MKYIPIYFPASNQEIFSSNIEEQHIKGEKKHYFRILKHVLSNAGFSLSMHMKSEFNSVISQYLNDAFTESFIKKSDWVESRFKNELKKMWNVRTEENTSWMNRLRDHHEEVTVCPYCGMIRNPSFDGDRMPIDHYLPKSEWPELTLIPTNLVPVCDSCNSRLKKEQALGIDGFRLFLHPFYDTFISKLHLNCEFTFGDEGNAPLVEYSLDTSLVTKEQGEIAISHLTKLSLNKRYTFRATQEIFVELKRAAEKLYFSCPDSYKEKFSSWLDIYATSIRTSSGPFHWKSAFITAVSNSEEFINWMGEISKMKLLDETFKSL